MLTAITISGLKSIKSLTAKCSSLTVFVGTNSSGKTSILQGIHLVAQNDFDKRSRFGLNGPFVRLGSFSEAYSDYCSREDSSIRIQLENNGSIIERIFNESLDSNEVSVVYNDAELLSPFSFFEQYYYLSCNRIGVQELYDYSIDNDRYGINGQYAFGFLLNHKNDVVDNGLIVSEKSKTLLSQLNWWLKNIVDSEVSVEKVISSNKVKVSYSVSNDQIYRSPFNVGSGLSYITTILIMCLSAPSQSILVIENPEVHLHPSAQSKLADFFYYIAKSGRQVIIETHSDHVFNGIRAGVATKEIDREKVVVNFVYKKENQPTECEEILFGDNGRIVNPRKDLFDQFDLDLNRMLGVADGINI